MLRVGPSWATLRSDTPSGGVFMRSFLRTSVLFAPAAALLMGTGCASSWGLTDLGDIAQCKTKFYYMDADGDGWGDPAIEREEICSENVDVESGWTARNGLDCDDADDGVTGRIDALCPHELVTEIEYEPGTGDPSDWYVTARGPETELVATGGSTPAGYPLAAEAACFYWGGSLAKLTAGEDKGNVLSAIEATLDGSETYAAWVAILWDYDLSSPSGADWGAKGNFRWMEPEDMDPEGTLPGAASENFPELVGTGESITWCSDVPPVEVHLQDGELNGVTWKKGDAYSDQWLKRVALVGTPDGGGSYRWCYGSPEFASDYDWSQAHMICERMAPSSECEKSANDYCDYRTPEETAALGDGAE